MNYLEIFIYGLKEIESMSSNEHKASFCKILRLSIEKYDGFSEHLNGIIDTLKDSNNCSVNNVSYDLQKTFRQIDCTDNPNIDVIIWECLGKNIGWENIIKFIIENDKEIPTMNEKQIKDKLFWLYLS